MLAVTLHGTPLVPGGATDGTLSGPSRARARGCLIDALPADMPLQQRAHFGAYVEAAAAADARGRHDVYMSSMNRLVFGVATDATGSLLRAHACSMLCRLTPQELLAAEGGGSSGQPRRPLEQLAHELLQRVETINEDVCLAAAAIPTTHRDRCPKCKATTNIQKVLAQLRRGDEGMTTQCMCGTCGATWHAK